MNEIVNVLCIRMISLSS